MRIVRSLMPKPGSSVVKVKLLPICTVVGMIILGGCRLLQPPAGQNQTAHNEDLSGLRLQFEEATDVSDSLPIKEMVTPSHDDTGLLTKKLDLISQTNKETRHTDGYTIQVYSGSSRDQASKVKAQVYRILPDARPTTKYDQPVYKVKVGQFADRLEAQGVYAKLRAEFPNALVIPEKILIDG